MNLFPRTANESGMAPARRRRFAVAALCGAILAAAGGCSGNEAFSEEEIKASLRQINKGYWTHLGFHRRPPDAAQLRTTVEDLHRLDMGNPAEQALVSPRDKKPLVIVYGANESDPSSAIMAYEQDGAEGTRWAVTMGGDIKQLTAEEFKQAAFARQHKPGGG